MAQFGEAWFPLVGMVWLEEVGFFWGQALMLGHGLTSSRRSLILMGNKVLISLVFKLIFKNFNCLHDVISCQNCVVILSLGISFLPRTFPAVF